MRSLAKFEGALLADCEPNLTILNRVGSTLSHEVLESTDPQAHRTISRSVFIVGVWTLLAVIRTPSALLVNGLPTDTASYWGWKFAEVLASLVPWMLATPLILLMAERLPLQRGGRARQLIIHLPMAIGITVVASGAGVLLSRPLFDHVPEPEAIWWTRQTIIASFYAVTSYIAVLGIGYAMAYLERDKLREQLLVEARLQSLTAQLNPHFLFNTLNAISALGYEDPALADESLSRLSDILRKSLSGLPARISLEQEIALTRQYADLHIMLIPDRLNVRYEIEAGARLAAVPSMLLQPLIENAITHGVSRLERGGEVVVNASVAKNKLCISVISDGPSLVGEDGYESPLLNRGLGLTNVCERLKVLYGDQQEFHLHHRPRGGVEASMTMPFVPLISTLLI